jgi:uncharacterized protein YndB with AHSA1/START domain
MTAQPSHGVVSTRKTEKPVTTFSTSREIPATAEQVFAAFSDPERLARWWGPAGFTNTFSACEFKRGGRWSYIMHGPNGGTYRNESVFADIEPPRKIVIQHVSKPEYRLTIALTSAAAGTVVSWSQAFESPDVARRIEHIVVPANEQNLDRLAAEVLSQSEALSQLIDRYCGVWSEPSSSRRAELLDQVWAPDATYTDPSVHAATGAELLAHIESVVARRPGSRVVRTSTVDIHHGIARFSWRVVQADGVALPDGLDIAELSSDGRRIRRIVGFFGPLRGL